MSRRQVQSAYLEVRRWTVDEVANVLQQYGLGDFVESFRKRNIDGDALLSLTEGILALWNRELSLPNIRKIGSFIEDIRSEPDKYCVTVRPHSLVSRSTDSVNRICSWNTVFENDIEYQNVNSTSDSRSRHSLQEAVNTTVYQNQIPEKSPTNGSIPSNIPSIPEKPPVPTRPPALKLRPKVDHTTTLPVPPIPEVEQYEHLKTFISYIKLPSPEEKGTYNADESSVYESPNLADTPGSPTESWKPIFNHWNHSEDPFEERYSSAEYESIKETNMTEYYVHPSAVDTSFKPPLKLSKLQLRELPEAPIPPVKPKGLSSNVSAPLPSSTGPPPPPPRPTESKPGQAENHEDDSFAVKSGRIEDILKKVINNPIPASGTLLIKEKVTASPELKKSTSSSTSSLNSVTNIKTNTGQATSLPDQRLPPNLRPLPPTPGTSSFRPNATSNAVPVRKTSNNKAGITQFPWYHNVDRKRGEELVFNGEDGTFLVRPSSQTQNPYTLTIWFGKRVYNIGVRFRADGKYALGTEKQNEQSFRSVEEMVSYYQSEQLVLYSGGERTGQTALKSSPKKE